MGREPVSTELYRVYLRQQVLRTLQGTSAANPVGLDVVLATLGPLVYEGDHEIHEAIAALVRAGKICAQDGQLWVHDSPAPP
jgi:hypothetical protein